MKHALTLLCGILGVPETTTEAELTTKAQAFSADVATSKNRAKQADDLEAENKKLKDEAIETDLTRFEDVIEDKESARELLQLNREAAVKTFAAQQAKRGGGGGNQPLYQKNRATPPDGKKFSSETADQEDQKADAASAYVAVVKNREKCSYEAAWNIARGEKPELFS